MIYVIETETSSRRMALIRLATTKGLRPVVRCRSGDHAKGKSIIDTKRKEFWVG
jgi:hypothetical protein